MKKKTKLGKLHRKERIWSLIFVMVPFIGFIIFTGCSLLFSIYYSFTDFNPIKSTTTFIWFKNYIDLFKNEDFRMACFNTIFLLIGIPIGMVLGLLLATYLKNKTRGYSTFIRMVYYLPAVSSAVAINIIWRYIFNGEFGLINSIFGLDIQWLGTSRWWIKVALIIKGIWGGLGGTLLLYLAGLNNIPENCYEAADIDGANGVQKFFKITVPLVKPVSFYLIITGVIGGLQSYAEAQIFAQGNKGAITIVYFIWERGIANNKYGLASAASVLLGIAIMIVTYFQFRKSDLLKVN